MKEPALKIFIHGSAVSLVSTGVLGLLNYLIRRELSIELSPTDYGIFYSGVALLGMIFSWGNLGICQSGTALIARYAACPKRHDCFMCAFCLKIFFALLCFAVIALFSNSISLKYWGGNFRWLLIILGVYNISNACFAAFRSLLDGLKKYALLRFFQLLATSLIFAGILLNSSLNLYTAAIAFAVGSLITVISMLIYGKITGLVRWKLPDSRSVWMKMFRMISWLAVSTMLFSTLSQIDTVMLTGMKGAQSVASYNIGLPIMQLVQSFLIFPAIFLPIAVQLCAEKAYCRIKNFIQWATVLSVVAGVAAFIFFGLTGAFWIRLLFSSRYEFVAPLLPWLCSGIVFFTTGNFFVQILVALGKLKTIAGIAITVFLLNIVLNYHLIQKSDYIGAGQATFSSYLIFAVLTLLLSWHFLRRKGIEQ